MVTGIGWDFCDVLCRAKTQWSLWIPPNLKCFCEKYLKKIREKFTIFRVVHSASSTCRQQDHPSTRLLLVWECTNCHAHLCQTALKLILETIPVCGIMWQRSQMCPCLVRDFCTFQLEGFCCWLTLLGSWGFSVELSQKTQEFRMLHKNYKW